MINSQLKKGLLDICVLSALCRGESYGYKILKDLADYIDLSESTLYPILRRLESAKYLTAYSVAHDGRLRKMYAITDAGRAQIENFLKDWIEIEKIYHYIQEGLENE